MLDDDDLAADDLGPTTAHLRTLRQSKSKVNVVLETLLTGISLSL